MTVDLATARRALGRPDELEDRFAAARERLGRDLRPEEAIAVEEGRDYTAIPLATVDRPTVALTADTPEMVFAREAKGHA